MSKAQKKIQKKKDLIENKTNKGKKRALMNLVFVFGIIFFVLIIFGVMSKIPKISDANSSNAHANDETQKILVTQEQKYQSINDIYMDLETGVTQINYINDATSTVSVIVTLQLKEGDALYTSELLKPGDTLEQVTLEQRLEKGTYDVEISVDSYSINGDEMVGGIIYERKLIVE
jgi:hypothetical protein